MSHTNATASDVQDLLETNLTTSEISPFLTAAQRFVTDNLEGAGVADATLTEIEKYLSAHLVTLKDPRLTDTSVGDVSESYQRPDDMTDYLRTAIMLDPTGRLARALDADKVGVTWKVGTYE